MTALDWALVGAYLAISLGLGLWFSRRAGQSSTAYLLGGRKAPWWLLGTSMVATSFAADTPLLVTELVRKHGIAGNWYWWNFLLGGMLTTVFFARMWRRSGVTTDLEFIALRYSGAAARWLRGVKAVYIGLFLNLIILMWVNLALYTFLEAFFPALSAGQIRGVLAGLLVLTALYSTATGLRGILVTDVFQFVLAMAGSILLAVLVVNSDAVGGLDRLKASVPTGALDFFPRFSAVQGEALALTPTMLFAFFGFQWWAVWYPGGEPAGGGYVAQRMLAAKNERHALAATFLHQVFFYVVRPWPWILVALATFVVYPNLDAAHFRQGYVLAVLDFLPAGAMGLFVAAILAAYMSTVSTHLNWGASYLVNDLYVPFLAPASSERRQVLVARIATLLLLVLSLLFLNPNATLEGAGLFLMQCGAGVGVALLLRWYWWRINAWAEMTATLVPFVVYLCIQIVHPADWADYDTIVWSVPITVFLTLVVAYSTPPTERTQLLRFYEKVRPQGIWPFPKPNEKQTPLWQLWGMWLMGVGLIYGLLFGLGAWLLK